jgi:hypothetical protein
MNLADMEFGYIIPFSFRPELLQTTGCYKPVVREVYKRHATMTIILTAGVFGHTMESGTSVIIQLTADAGWRVIMAVMGVTTDSFTPTMAAKLSEAQEVLTIGKIARVTSTQFGHTVLKDEALETVPLQARYRLHWPARILGSPDFHPEPGSSNTTQGCINRTQAIPTLILWVFSHHF